jgi:type I restriction enzyme R subunit
MVAQATAIGWTAIPPEVAKQQRGREARMLFRDELEAVLARFNPWLSADAIRQLIERLEAIPATVEDNREMMAWLRGERQWYDEAERRHLHIQLLSGHLGTVPP